MLKMELDGPMVQRWTIDTDVAFGVVSWMVQTWMCLDDIPSGNLTYLWNITMFNVYIHYFYGDFVNLPEGIYGYKCYSYIVLWSIYMDQMTGNSP